MLTTNSGNMFCFFNRLWIFNNRPKKADNVSIIGYSHELTGKECQDSSVSWQSEKYSSIIISDGHGGEKYIRSAKGSQFACSIGKYLISSFMDTLLSDNRLYDDFTLSPAKQDELLSRLERSIIQHWNQKVESDLNEFPIENDERYLLLSDKDKQSVLRAKAKAYGATFIAAVVAGNCFFILKLGDGNVCLRKRGKARLFYGEQNELEDDRLQFNLTTSLCSSEADKEFKHCFVNTKKFGSIGGLILTTDGIINSYPREQSYLHFIGNIFKSYKRNTKESAHSELSDFLPRLSKKGSGDDLTVGIIF